MTRLDIYGMEVELTREGGRAWRFSYRDGEMRGIVYRLAPRDYVAQLAGDHTGCDGRGRSRQAAIEAAIEGADWP